MRASHSCRSTNKTVCSPFIWQYPEKLSIADLKFTRNGSMRGTNKTKVRDLILERVVSLAVCMNDRFSYCFATTAFSLVQHFCRSEGMQREN